MVETSGKPREARIAFLDYLRIFAFSSVLIGHKFLTYFQDIATNANVHASARLLASYLIPLFTGGGAGVVVFFLVHAAASGLSLVGDNFYDGIRSLYLHLVSCALMLPHPITGATVEISLPPSLSPSWVYPSR